MPVLYRYNGTAFEAVGIPPAVVIPAQTSGQFNVGNIVEITNDTMNNAFPGLAVAANGEKRIYYRKSTAHNPPPAGTPGVVVSRKATSAKGTSWSAETTVYTAAAGQPDARDPSVSRLADNRIALTVFDYLSESVSTAYALFSSDNGKTFTGKASLNASLTTSFVCGPIVQLANGNLLASVYGFEGAETVYTNSVIARSTDGGVSWSRLALVPKHTANTSYDEPTLYVDTDNSVLLFIRNTTSSSIRVARSTDGGATFSASVHLFGGDSRVAIIRTTNGCYVAAYRGTGNAMSVRYCWGNPLVPADWTAEQIIDPGFRSVYASFYEVTPNVLACVYAMEEINQDDGDVKIVYLYTAENLDPIA